MLLRIVTTIERKYLTLRGCGRTNHNNSSWCGIDRDFSWLVWEHRNAVLSVHVARFVNTVAAFLDLQCSDGRTPFWPRVSKRVGTAMRSAYQAEFGFESCAIRRVSLSLRVRGSHT